MRLAEAITSTAAEAGRPAAIPLRPQAVEIAVDALDIARVRPFWAAVGRPRCASAPGGTATSRRGLVEHPRAVEDTAVDADAEAVVARYLDAVNRHDRAALADVACDRLQLAIHWFSDGNPDLRFVPDWLSVAGDKVTTWVYGEGTHTGMWTLPPSVTSTPYAPLPPTGRRWRAACSATYQVEDGRITDFWIAWDWLALLDQLGVVTYERH